MTAEQTDQTYNGWTNYATWGVALVLDNDQSSYNSVRQIIAETRQHINAEPNVIDGTWTAEQATKYRLASELKNYVEWLCGLEGDEDNGIPEPSMMAQQVIQAGLADVDWDEIAANLLAE